MPPVPIRLSADEIDLSPRRFTSIVVAASPAAGAETIIATLTCAANIAALQSVRLLAWCAYTVGTNGVSANLRIRQTDASGSIKAATGAVTATAANLDELTAMGLDTAPTLPGQVYVATLTVGSGSAPSTVSAVYLEAYVF